jgi:flagellar basal body rod protein FlgB
VARASLNPAGFALPTDRSRVAPDGPIDLEQEMVSLADEQLHFEATAKLLEKAYAQLRLAIKDK